MMLILFAVIFFALVVLALVGCLSLQTWNSQARMVNADWLDTAEKFKMIARWGA